MKPLSFQYVIILIYLAQLCEAKFNNQISNNALEQTQPAMENLYEELRNLSQRLDAVNSRITIDSWFTALLTSDMQSRMDNISAELGLDDDISGLRTRLQNANIANETDAGIQHLEKRLGALEANELQTSLDQHIKKLNDRIDAQERVMSELRPNIAFDDMQQQLIQLNARIDTLELARVTNDAEKRLHTLTKRIDVLVSLQDQLATKASLEKLSLQLAELTKTIDALDPLSKNVSSAIPSHSNSNSIPTNCYEALGQNDISGIYEILIPAYNATPFKVYCEAEHGSGWTVVQRRESSKVNFNRNWNDYKYGFGKLNESYFIGMEKLHALTSTKEKQELFIILKDFTGVTKTAYYTEFAVDDEKNNYSLKKLGNFVGSHNLPDSLRIHVNMKFSTKDHSNDLSKGNHNCATRYTGGWWFNNCASSHLNGKLLPPNEGQGIFWRGFDEGNKISNLKFAQMMIRPRIN